MSFFQEAVGEGKCQSYFLPDHTVTVRILSVQVQSDLCSEFQNSQGYIVRPWGEGWGDICDTSISEGTVT